MLNVSQRFASRSKVMIELLRLVAIVVLVVGAMVAFVRMIRAYSVGDMATGFAMIALVMLFGGLEIFIGDVGKHPVNRWSILVSAIAFVSSILASARARSQRMERQ